MPNASNRDEWFLDDVFSLLVACDTMVPFLTHEIFGYGLVPMPPPRPPDSSLVRAHSLMPEPPPKPPDCFCMVDIILQLKHYITHPTPSASLIFEYHNPKQLQPMDQLSLGAPQPPPCIKSTVYVFSQSLDDAHVSRPDLMNRPAESLFFEKASPIVRALRCAICFLTSACS